MAGAGADVAVTYVNSRQAAENVAAEMRALGVRARPVRADQGDPAAAAAVVRQVAEEFGRLDILVNNAAVAVLGPIDGPVPDGAALDRQIRVNYTSIVAAIRAAARVLPEGGRIINIGSGIATRTGASGVADHAGTKAALAGFTRGAARDLYPWRPLQFPATSPRSTSITRGAGNPAAASARAFAAIEIPFGPAPTTASVDTR